MQILICVGSILPVDSRNVFGEILQTPHLKSRSLCWRGLLSMSRALRKSWNLYQVADAEATTLVSENYVIENQSPSK
jgi:hypothetical protein